MAIIRPAKERRERSTSRVRSEVEGPSVGDPYVSAAADDPPTHPLSRDRVKVEKEPRVAGAGTTSASDDHLNELVISIQSRFVGLSRPYDCCIFVVPERLRRTNQDAYTPRVVAIGPYHHDDPSLRPMEDHKLWYLRNFLEHNQNCCLKDYIERVKSWENEARNCYDKEINLNSNQFAQMMLLDGIFVIQLFRTLWKSQLRLHDDWIFDKPGMLDDVCRDMALLENQMPFFAIQRLFEMAFGTRQEDMPGLLELACWFFKPVMRMEKLPDSEVKHFVDVIRLSFLPSVNKVQNEGNKEVQNESNKEMKNTPSATELVAAGVKLRRVDSKCLFDVKFKNGVLNIPYLALDDMTESYFRNIIAFEQCYCLDTYLTDYVAFMSRLVDTPGDAKLLIDKEIIVNWLSDKQAVAQLINTLSKEVGLSPESYYFYSVSDKLINHCRRPCNKWKAIYNNKWKATFKRDYCRTPWVTISVIAAGVLLFLSAAQTVCSVLSLK